MRAKLFIGVATAAILVVILMLVRGRTRAPQTAMVSPGATAAKSAETHGIPAQRQIAQDIAHFGITAERAKQYFALAIGPLPGVGVPAGGQDSSDFDGTLAIGYLHKVWGSLTPEQRNAASDLVGGTPTHATGRLPRSVTAAAAYLYFAPNTPAFEYTKLGSNADGTLAAFLGVPGVEFDVAVKYGAPEGTEYAHTWSWTYGNVLGWDRGCHITVWNQKFLGLNDSDAEAVMTHEMTHCFQQRTAQSAAQWETVHGWIGEGEATWTMFTMVPSANNTTIQETKWTPYVFGPKTVYSDRQYDALGVYGHLSDLAGDQLVWSQLLPIVTAGIGGNDAAAFNLLTQGFQSTYFDTWGPSYFLTQGQKKWTMFGPGQPPLHGPAPISIAVEAGTEEALASVGPYQSELFQLSGGADIVRLALFTGYGRLHDQDFAIDTSLENSAPLALCMKQGGCKCPDGSPGASQVTKVATAPLSIGVNGGDTTAQLGVAGLSLDKFCKKPDQPAPQQPPGPGGGGGGGGGDGQTPPDNPPPPPGESFGDTHLSTFDGVKYDFQVVGEFTLVRSTKDDFAVQIRQVPVVGTNNASVNGAMATTLGGQRITVTMENGAAVLRVDGQVINGGMPKLKTGSLSEAITAFGTTYRLTWPDGSEVRVAQLGRDALNVQVRPAASRRGTLEGLLGNDDGVPGNDMAGNETKPDDVYHAFADAWRVKQAVSRFDYQQGQSTATFTVPNFPASGAVGDITNRAEAEKACRERNITDPQLLQDCITDLAATHNFIFGSQYAHAQQVLAARALLVKPKAPSGRGALMFSGEIRDATSQPEMGFDANKDDVIWVHDPDCTDHTGTFHPVFLAVFDASGKRVGGGMGCQFGRLELPATGRYTIRATFGYRGEVGQWRIPIRFRRHTRRDTVRYGQMVSGNIEEAGVRDVYSFQGTEGDVVLLSGAGCDLGSFVTDFTDPKGNDLLAPGCRAGTLYKLPMSGTWQLVVNAMDWATGPYHFVLQGGKPQ